MITQADQLVLCAALCEGEKAKQAWWTWRATLDFDQCDPRYIPLIPLLQQNLAQLGVQDPLFGKFKGIQRRVWYKNQLLLREVSDLIQIWQTDGIESICLNDIAIAGHYHANLGLRPIHTFQFLIQPTQLTAASHWLQQKGWNPVHKQQQGRFQRFVNAAGMKLDLHLHLFSRRLYTGDAALFWADSRTIQIQDMTAYGLNPIEQFLILCSQPPQKQFARLLWIADALTILRHPQIELDWKRLATANFRAYLRLRLYTSLHYLAKNYAAPIPTDILHFLATAHPLARKLPTPILRTLFTYVDQRFFRYS